jgi:predicted ABC-type transport system involved in lysophospholipase L1 biosynthesis ATPase subunit
MQRRARARASHHAKPSVLLLDEPYANLDEDGVELMNSVIRDVIASGGAALLLFTSLHPLARFCDRTLTLIDGGLRPAILSALLPNRHRSLQSDVLGR